MNRIFILATIILLASCKTSTITINNTSELKEITLKEIWDGTFSPERMNALNEANK
jgi:dipeptidyl-peptidase-4